MDTDGGAWLGLILIAIAYLALRGVLATAFDIWALISLVAP